MSLIAGVYGGFQFMMPMLGWICVHTIEERFVFFQPFIPWIAFALLVWIGGKMLIEGIREQRRTGANGIQNLPEAAGANGIQNLPEAAGVNGTQNPPEDADANGTQNPPEAAGANGTQNPPEDAPADGGNPSALTLPVLLMQGVATSIDALSVGFTIAGYDLRMAFLSCVIIGAVTFLICMAGLAIGRKAGMKLAGKAGIAGGLILIAIGLEIVISSFI